MKHMKFWENFMSEPDRGREQFLRYLTPPNQGRICRFFTFLNQMGSMQMGLGDDEESVLCLQNSLLIGREGNVHNTLLADTYCWPRLRFRAFRLSNIVAVRACLGPGKAAANTSQAPRRHLRGKHSTALPPPPPAPALAMKHDKNFSLGLAPRTLSLAS